MFENLSEKLQRVFKNIRGEGKLTAENMEAALREIEHDGVDFVFSDIVMPGKMDGLSLAHRLRELRPHLPVLLATGYSDAAAGARGDFPILRKPYEIHQLSQAIAKLPR